MRIAHIIMAHKNPEQLMRLVKRLQHPQFDIYIHIDKKVALSHFQMISEEDNVRFIKNRQICNWGGYSFLNAIFHSLNEVLSTSMPYDFINLLSGQDYPIKSNSDIFEYFSHHKGINFISFDDSSVSEWWKHANSRYEKYHFTDFRLKGKYLLQYILNTFSSKRRFPIPLKLYGGSNSTWWTISGACAKYLTELLINNRSLISFLKYTWSPDEFIVASLIMGSDFKEKTINNNLRYIDWSEGKAHPKILLEEDLYSIKNSEMLFARKFDMTIESNIIDHLDH